MEQYSNLLTYQLNEIFHMTKRNNIYFCVDLAKTIFILQNVVNTILVDKINKK